MAQKQMPSTIVSMIVVLLIISLVSGGLLAATNSFTAEPIAVSNLNKTISAFRQVLAGFDNDPMASELTSQKYPDIKMYTLKKADQILGYAVISNSSKGYNGKIAVMVGISPFGKITGLSVTELSETPGLGTKVKLPKFQDQFIDSIWSEPGFAVKKDGGSIDAVSAATISSRAFCDVINRAYAVYKEFVHE